MNALQAPPSLRSSKRPGPAFGEGLRSPRELPGRAVQNGRPGPRSHSLLKRRRPGKPGSGIAGPDRAERHPAFPKPPLRVFAAAPGVQTESGKPGCRAQSQPPAPRRGECVHHSGSWDRLAGAGSWCRAAKALLVPTEPGAQPAGLTAKGNLFVRGRRSCVLVLQPRAALSRDPARDGNLCVC